MAPSRTSSPSSSRSISWFEHAAALPRTIADVVPLAIALELDEGGGWVFVWTFVDVDVDMIDARIRIEVIPKTELTRCSLS